jgi:hypothetical protein
VHAAVHLIFHGPVYLICHCVRDQRWLGLVGHICLGVLVHCQVVRFCQVVLFLVGQVVLVRVQQLPQQQPGLAVLVGFALLGAVVLGRLVGLVGIVGLVLLALVWLIDLDCLGGVGLVSLVLFALAGLEGFVGEWELCVVFFSAVHPRPCLESFVS